MCNKEIAHSWSSIVEKIKDNIYNYDKFTNRGEYNSSVIELLRKIKVLKESNDSETKETELSERYKELDNLPISDFM